jgi:hypothetical protein
MDSSPPGPTSQDAASPRKRPWYLVLALLVGSLFGVLGFVGGWGTISLYREKIEFQAAKDGLKDPAHQAAVEQAGQRWLQVLDEEKGRVFPLAAGELVLGLAAFFLAAGAMAGRDGARRALVQVLIAQAALVVTTHAMTPRVRAAQIELVRTARNAQLEEADPVKAAEVRTTDELVMPLLPAFEWGIVAGRTFVAALVLLALTRRRVREHFEAMSAGAE